MNVKGAEIIHDTIQAKVSLSLELVLRHALSTKLLYSDFFKQKMMTAI